jgi:negative regulator of flagellin synthesis FlgM
MAVEFFGVRGFGQIGNIGKTNSPGEPGKTGATGEKSAISFNQALQETKGMQGIKQTQDPERATKVEQLKAQVNSDSYEPDLSKVASSLLKFLVEEG